MSSNTKSKLILASASPRRLDLLTRMGFAPDKVVPADIDESVRKGEKPEIYVMRMAEEKAGKIKSNIASFLRKQESGEAVTGLDPSFLWDDAFNDCFILGSDTTVVCANQIIGKAGDRADAKRIMEVMRGRKHKVLTAVCVISPAGEKRCRLVVTSVKFKNATDSEIEEYLDKNEWQGKAGAYGIQGDPGGFCISINGSFSSVMGLPMYETKNLLLGLGFKRG